MFFSLTFHIPCVQHITAAHARPFELHQRTRSPSTGPQKRAICTITAHDPRLRAGGFCTFMLLLPDRVEWPVGAGIQQKPCGALTRCKVLWFLGPPTGSFFRGQCVNHLVSSPRVRPTQRSPHRCPCSTAYGRRVTGRGARAASFSRRGSTVGLETSKEHIVASIFNRNSKK